MLFPGRLPTRQIVCETLGHASCRSVDRVVAVARRRLDFECPRPLGIPLQHRLKKFWRMGLDEENDEHPSAYGQGPLAEDAKHKLREALNWYFSRSGSRSAAWGQVQRNTDVALNDAFDSLGQLLAVQRACQRPGCRIAVSQWFCCSFNVCMLLRGTKRAPTIDSRSLHADQAAVLHIIRGSLSR